MGASEDMDSQHIPDAHAHATADVGHVEEAAPSEADADASVPIWEVIKANKSAIGYSFLLAMGPMVYGYDLMIVGVITAMPAFQKVFGSYENGQYIIPALWLSLWTSMIQVGAMIGALCSGPISNRIGRKKAFGLGGLIIIAGVFLIFFSDRCGGLDAKRVVFMVGKILEGGGLAVMNATCLTLISEIAPSRVRGPLLSCFTLFAVVGQIIAVAAMLAEIDIESPIAYRTVLAIQWGLAGIILFIAVVIPESPAYLIRQNKLENAAKAYKRLHPHADIAKEITALQTLVEHEIETQRNEEATNLVQCLRGTDFRRTRIIVYANILQQFVGITMVVNATYFLELAGMSANLTLDLTIIELVLGVPAIIISWFTMTIFGRRTIILWGSCVSTVLWLAMGIAGCWPNSSAALWFIGIVLIVIFVVYSLSVGAAYPVIAAETSSLHLRAASQSIGFFFQFLFAWAFSFTIPYMYDVDSGNLGGKVGFVFTGFGLIAIALVWFEFPEMKGRTFAELDEIFEQKVPTRKFTEYVCTGVLAETTKADEAGM